MTKEAQGIALAKEIRWQKAPYNDTDYYVPMLGKPYVACDPLHDLNAIHEAEKMLTFNEAVFYEQELKSVQRKQTKDGDCPPSYYHLSAAQRAEAFLRAKGLWVD